MSEDSRDSRWFEVPKEVLDDLEVPEGDAGEVKGGALNYFYKVTQGGDAFLKISQLPAVQHKHLNF